ncbi:MAG: SRPBCC domain-containing protein [Candidatus Thermoplasmatota archaeon]|nr:SRPBCC domain-containing protein [Candidatus Thermoplasmatota archaeon]
MGEAEISDEAVVEATGESWAHWLALLDRWGAKDRDHAEIAAYLAETHGLSPWWSQTVTVHYERIRGLRELGETAGGTFQVGVTRTLPAEEEDAWATLLGGDGLAAWLGPGAPDELREGASFRLDDETQVEVRVLKPGSHIRLFWHPPGFPKPSTLQVRVLERKIGAAISFHHEGLPSAEMREAMRAHWRSTLETLEARVAGPR